MTARNIWMSFALAAALLAGCGDDDRPTFDAGGGGDSSVMDADTPAECPTGTTMCGSACVDTQNSSAHCGACENACPAGEACVEGSCGVLCPGGQTICDGSCVDTEADRRHCGACGDACGAGEVCVDGACEISCPEGQVVCDGACADTDSDPAHCGACGEACAAGEVCTEGTCAAECGAGLMDCDGACVDTQNHPSNCGACGEACEAPDGASGLCMGGSCRAICDTLMGDCNADLTSASGDGCETPLSTDPLNCGACSRECTLANAAAGCDTGACVITTCDGGYSDCDGAAANGCESDVRFDDANCGACGTTCASGEECFSAVCQTQGTGEDCSSPWYLAEGANVVSYTATTADYLTTTPDCVSTGSVEGPDVVMAYTATRNERVTFEITPPSSTRWAMTVSTEACGTPDGGACASEFGSTMSASLWMTAGETAYVYVVDTSSGSNPLDNPLDVQVTVETPPCFPGVGGMVGTTVTRVPTGLSSFTEYYVAVDEDPSGYAYVGGTSTLYRIPKAGGATEDVEADAGLTFTHLGYAMLVDGSDIYTINNTTSGTTEHIFRISTDGGSTWDVQDYATFPMTPEDDFKHSTIYGGSIHMMTDEASDANPTEVWSMPAGATTIPATPTLDLSFTGEEDCNGLAVDDDYYYALCWQDDRLVRVDRATGAVELIDMGTFDVPLSGGALVAVDPDGDGTADLLYVKDDEENVGLVCAPASAAPFVDRMVSWGSGSSNYGLAYDSVANALWAWDDDTREFIVIE